MMPMSPVIKKGRDEVQLPEVVYAKDQPEYIPLPVVKQRSGIVTSRWRLTIRERLSVLLHGSVYLQIHTFNRPLQPTRMSVESPEIGWMDCVDPLDAEKMKEN
jgi:hypothetical protein